MPPLPHRLLHVAVFQHIALVQTHTHMHCFRDMQSASGMCQMPWYRVAWLAYPLEEHAKLCCIERSIRSIYMLLSTHVKKCKGFPEMENLVL